MKSYHLFYYLLRLVLKKKATQKDIFFHIIDFLKDAIENNSFFHGQSVKLQRGSMDAFNTCDHVFEGIQKNIIYN